MKSFFRSACIMTAIAAGLILTGCAKKPPAAQNAFSPSPEAARKATKEETIVAKVNGVALSLDSLENMMTRIGMITHETPTAAQTEEFRKRALNQLIMQELALQEAARLGVKARPSEVDAAITALVGHDENDYNEFLKKQNLSNAEFRSELGRTIVLRRVFIREVIEKALVSEDEVRKEYEARKEKYIVPGKVSVLDLALAASSQSNDQSQKKAKKLLAQIKSDKGHNLRELASKASFTVHERDLEKDKEPALYEAARKLKPGTLSSVIKDGDAVHILRLTAYAPERQLSFEEVKGELERKLRADAIKQRRDAWEQELEKEAQIEIMPSERQEQKNPETAR